jgi:GTP cyclohydrolase I
MDQKKFEENIKENLMMFGEDINREGLIDTPKRVYESYEFLLQGYKQNPKKILEKALFTSSNKSMVVIKDIDLFSMCEHHILPIIGKAYIAYIPNGKVAGLSKIPRIVDVFSKRLQIQEELTEQISSCLQEVLSPLGVGVIIKARHMCMEMRGVEKTGSQTVTTSYKGAFTKKHIKEEFLFHLN